MTKTEAINALKRETGADAILDVMRGYDFYEITAKRGNDRSVYRVYESGKVYER